MAFARSSLSSKRSAASNQTAIVHTASRTHLVNRRLASGNAKTAHPFRIVLVGAPGSGKGTQANKLTRDYNVLNISSGNLLRKSIADQTELGKQADSHMKQGSLVPDEIVWGVVEQGLKAKDAMSKGWVLDGFPRTVSQSEQLDAMLESIGQPIDVVFYLEISEDIIKERLKERLVHVPSGRVYNLSFNPPKVPGIDDITGEPLVKRNDDDDNTVAERMKAYHAQTEPLVGFYQRTNRLCTVPSPTSDIGYVTIQKFLNDLLHKRNQK